jgi:ribosome-binding protein aMBF1 (putative translation factor)
MVNLVEAIHDGRIVKVPEDYAVREGLLILRKDTGRSTSMEVSFSKSLDFNDKKLKEKVEGRLDFDDFRRPLNWREGQVVRDLVDNFHWQIVRARRAKGMTRGDFASELGIKENEVKLIEHGTFPFKDYILINRMQVVLGINLRKDGKDFGKSPRVEVDSEKEFASRGERVLEKKRDVVFEGDDVELF